MHAPVAGVRVVGNVRRAARPHRVRCLPSTNAESQTETLTQRKEELSSSTATISDVTSNGASTSTSSDKDSSKPSHKDWVPDYSVLSPPSYSQPSGQDKFWTNLKLAFALPWRRFKKESVLTIKVSISKQWFSM
jgi:protease-4